VGPSFQLSKLFSSSIRDPWVIARCPLFIRYRVPAIRGIVISAWPGSGLLRDIEHGCDGGCEDEAFEGGIFLGGLEDGECSRDGRIDQSFGDGGTCRGFVR
jgi:hypothetical protein